MRQVLKIWEGEGGTPPLPPASPLLTCLKSYLTNFEYVNFENNVIIYFAHLNPFQSFENAQTQKMLFSIEYVMKHSVLEWI